MKRTMVIVILAALGVCLSLTRTSSAQGEKRADDRSFVLKAAGAGIAEVKLGELAEKQATSPDVKKFAARMVQDHTQANHELTKIVEGRGIQLPTTLDKKHQEVYDRLSKLTGAEFDQDFMRHMLEDHKDAVALFEAQAKDGQDAALKAFATKTLPTLREHLKMAQQLVGKSG
jgi:putative membrane protein